MDTLISSNCKDTERIFSVESKAWSWAMQDSKLTSAYSFLCYIKALAKTRVFAKFNNSLFLRAVLVYILTCWSAPEPGQLSLLWEAIKNFATHIELLGRKALGHRVICRPIIYRALTLLQFWFCMFAFRNQPLFFPKSLDLCVHWIFCLFEVFLCEAGEGGVSGLFLCTVWWSKAAGDSLWYLKRCVFISTCLTGGYAEKCSTLVKLWY